MSQPHLNRFCFQVIFKRLALGNVDGLGSIRSNGDKFDRTPNQRFDFPRELDRLGWQIVEASGARDIGLPARDRFVNRLHVSEIVDLSREMGDSLAIEFVRNADFDFFELAKHVQHRQGNGSHPAQASRVSCRHRIPPTATPGPTGRCSILVAKITNVLAFFVVLLGRERSTADSRRVALGDSDDL